MVVVMVTGRMVMTVASVEPAMAGSGESESCHCNRCNHYRQFLVHVFLHFLSLLTIC
jgi:hypothetical protein